ncbi:MAG: hypothetical protein RLZZ565_23 [Planctomycetota bacterium]
MTEHAQSTRNRSNAARLATYATAATGAALSVSSSDAAVVIVNIAPRDASATFTISLNAAGTSGAYTFFNTGLTPGPGFQAKINATTQNDAFQFVASTLVGTNVLLDTYAVNWNGGTKAFASAAVPSSGETKYLGFILATGENRLRFGWIEYVNNGTSTTVSRWAYESVINTGIRTPTVSAVPGGAGLAALALGAAGLRGRRRSRN